MTTLSVHTRPSQSLGIRPRLDLGEAAERLVPPKTLHDGIRLMQGDCLVRMAEIESESVHLVVTDPPYFLDGLGTDWRKGNSKVPKGSGAVGGLPVGMKFDPRQGKELQSFIESAGRLMLDVLAPGGFAAVFSQPRLSHRMGVGLEDAGFEIRDMFAWRYTKRAQFKAFSMNHFVDRMNISDHEKARMKGKLDGRKTPQLRPQFESIILAQKPKKGTFVENWMRYETGLIDPDARLDGKVPATVMTVEKPDKSARNDHLTVKPVLLIEHLIKLFSLPNQVVLDPFLGSGTTAIAAHRTDRACIGIEISQEIFSKAERRIKESIQ